MSDPAPHRVQQLFLAALQVPGDELDAWLAEHCGGDDRLAEEIRSLLAHDDPTNDPLEANRSPGLNKDGTENTKVHLPQIPGYELKRQIGVGGEAVVYEAVQTSTSRRVAVKVLRMGEFASEKERERFDRGVRLLANLQHTNILAVIDRGQTRDGLDYLVTELVDGWPVDKYVDQRLRHIDGQELKPTALLTLFLRIADAVAAAHEAGVIHRDLKPSNILVDRRGEPRVIDFGLAKSPLAGWQTERTLTISGQFVGSLPWASPEQADGDLRRIGKTSDVYSLGVILYQILTGGSFPYKVVGNMRDVLDNIINAAPTPPSLAAKEGRSQELERSTEQQIRRGLAPIHPSIEAIVLKALEKRPERRQQSAGELAGEIRQYLSGMSPHATSTAAATQEPSSRRAAALCVIAAAAVLVGLFFITRKGENVSSHGGHAPDSAPVADEDIETRLASLAKQGRYDEAADAYVTWSWNHRKSLSPDEPDPQHEQVTVAFAVLSQKLYDDHVSDPQKLREVAVILRAIIREDQVERLGRTATLWAYGGNVRGNLAWILARSENLSESDLLEIQRSIDYQEAYHKLLPSEVADRGYRGSSRFALAQALHNLKRLPEAQEQYEEAAALLAEHQQARGGDSYHPWDLVTTRWRAAWLAACSGKLPDERAQSALEFARYAQQIQPEVVEIRVAYAAALYRAGQIEEAIKAFRKLESHPDSNKGAVRLFLSLIHADQGDLSAARAFRDRAAGWVDLSGGSTPELDLLWTETAKALNGQVESIDP